MSAPAIFAGTRTKLLSSKGLLLQSGVTIDNDGAKSWATSTAYVVGDILLFNNELYIVNTAHTSSASNINVDILTGNVEKLEDTDNLLKTSAKFSTSASGNPWIVGTVTGYSAGTFPSGALNVTFIGTVTATNVIDGKYALSVPATTTGVGSFNATPTMAVTTAYSGKNLQLSFDYKIFSGSSFANLSGTSANTYYVLVYDITNSVWLQPTNTYGLTSLQGTWSGTVQPNTTCAQLKMVILQANNTVGGNVDLSCDNFYIGKKIAPTGPVFTDPVAYTPTFGAGYGTVTNQKIYWQQAGKFMRVFGTATMGTVTAGTGEISLPSGKNIDSSYYQASAKNIVGGIRNITNAGGVGAGGTTQRLGFDGTNLDKVWLTSSSTQDIAGGTFRLTGVNSALSTSDTLNIDFTVPILGWSSNVQLSSDAGNSQIVMSAYKNGGAVTANTTIPSWTFSSDSAGMFNATTGVCTIPSPGDYDIEFGIGLGASAQILVNGTIVAGASSSGSRFVKTTQRNLKANDLITFTSDTSGTLNANNFNTIIAVAKKASPQTIAANDTVAASYYLSANQGITANSTRINYDTKIFDYQGSSVTTGAGWVYTAQTPGLYSVEVRDQVASSSTSYIVQTGSISAKHPGAAQSFGGLVTSATFRMIVGDQFYVLNNTNQTISGGIDGTIGYLSKITVKKIGNY